MIEEVIEEEIVKLCSDMRGCVTSGDFNRAAITEGRIAALEGFWALLHGTAKQYKPPTT